MAEPAVVAPEPAQPKLSMDPKEKFYRRFQETVTGTSTISKSCTETPPASPLRLAIHSTLDRQLTPRKALQEEIAQLESYSSIAGERQDAIDHILAGISGLSNEVSDASEFIPAYDQRTYAQVRILEPIPLGRSS